MGKVGSGGRITRAVLEWVIAANIPPGTPDVRLRYAGGTPEVRGIWLQPRLL